VEEKEEALGKDTSNCSILLHFEIFEILKDSIKKSFDREMIMKIPFSSS